MNLEPKYILSYYDFPELFVSTDSDNLFYISLFVDSINENARYLTRNIFIDELLDLIEKKISILDVFNKDKDSFWYLLDSSNEFDFKISQISFSREIPKNYFPTKDYIRDFHSEEIVKEIFSTLEIRKIDFETHEKYYSNWRLLPKINKTNSSRQKFSFVSTGKFKKSRIQPITFFLDSIVNIIDSVDESDMNLIQNNKDYSYVFPKQKMISSFI